MIEEILPNLHRIEIPLPRNPLRSLNSYVVKGQDRFLIIDTGMNREECLHPMRSSLEELKVDLNKTDFFITHFHADHLGLVGNLATDASKIYFSQIEANFIQNREEKRGEQSFGIYLSYGFPEDEFGRSLQDHPGLKYSSKKRIDFSTVKEGDKIEIGDYSFNCIYTPGHTPGHMCLYEPTKKILISGDHILFDITPNITYWTEELDSLRDYLASLEKVYPLDVDFVLPGHRRLINDHKGRIRELQEHHKGRLQEVLDALEDGDKNAWEVAPHITWDIDVKSWDMFPPAQKWFAFGETLAHLIYLETDGRIRRKMNGGKIIFSLAR
jgi:glyoxylase-like metal-dependent hydrolase (beta-lactamase superfamily II)